MTTKQDREEKMVIEYKPTGECSVDVYEVCKQWDHRFNISKYHDEYTLVKYKRKNSEEYALKVQIPYLQAMMIIANLGLTAIRSSVFKNAITYKKLTQSDQ